MRLLTLTVAVALTGFSLGAQNAPWTMDALLSLPSLGDPQIRSDGKACVYVQQGRVYLAPIEGGTPKELAAGRRPRWSPDSKLLAFLADRNHVVQIFLYDPKDGKVRPFSDSPSSVSSFSWAPDGRAIGYLAADPDPAPDPEISGKYSRFSRLYWQPLEGSAKRVTSGNFHVTSFAISPAGDRAVFAAHPTPLNQDSLQSDLYTVVFSTLAVTPLVVQPGRDAEPSYSPDGKWIAFHSQGGSSNYFEKREVALIPSGGGTPRYITRGHPEDAFRGGNNFTWSADSGTLIYTAGKGVRDVLIRHEIQSDHTKILAEGIAGAASFTPDLSRAVFLKVNRAHPPEIFYYEGKESRQLTHVFQYLEKFQPFSSEVVKWKSKDGSDMEGMLWLPVGYQAGKRVPMLTELHGGPTGVTLDAFPTPRTYPVEMYLQNGIAVFSPNFRGSVNYGAGIRMKNALSQGEGDYDDVMTGIDSLIARGIADADRLGIMGWSYGGYLTISTVTQTNRFKAASIGAPATDWATYYGQSDGPKEVLWTYFGGTPWEVPESYARHSPRAKLKNVRTPCLLQVGMLDINHNAEIYRALTDNHVEVEYDLYPREPHGFTEPKHIRDVMEKNLNWFLKRL
ncbi:MAG: S9 family peptidase [Bryobacteraceae bacterium]